MPRGDGTGPNGMGPLTGHRGGYCAGYGVPGYANAGYGRGIGFGGSRGGRGYRNRYYATGLTGWQRWAGGQAPWGNPYAPAPFYGPQAAQMMTEQQELDILKGQTEYLETTLESLRKRIEELETKQ